jgi:hypothetical protein
MWSWVWYELENKLIELLKYLESYPLIKPYLHLAGRVINTLNLIYIYIFNYTLVYIQTNYPLSFKWLLSLYIEYYKIISGKLECYHANFFILLGILLNNLDYFALLFCMFLSIVIKDFILSKKDYFFTYKVFKMHPYFFDIIICFISSIYLICLYECITISYECLLLPFVNKIKLCINNTIVKMSGLGGSSSNYPDPSPNPNPSPSPNPSRPPSPSNPSSETISEKKEGNKKTNTSDKRKKELTEDEREQLEMEKDLRKLEKACDRLADMQEHHDNQKELNVTLKNFLDKYYLHLPKKVKEKLVEADKAFEDKGSIEEKGGYYDAHSVKNYWELVKHDNNARYKNYKGVFTAFEQNSKKIKNDSLGGADSTKSKAFNEEFFELRKVYKEYYKNKGDFIQSQINKSSELDKVLIKREVTMSYLFRSGKLK